MREKKSGIGPESRLDLLIARMVEGKARAPSLGAKRSEHATSSQTFMKNVGMIYALASDPIPELDFPHSLSPSATIVKRATPPHTAQDASWRSPTSTTTPLIGMPKVNWSRLAPNIRKTWDTARNASGPGDLILDRIVLTTWV